MKNSNARLFGFSLLLIAIGFELPLWVKTGSSDWVGGILVGISIGMLWFNNYEEKVKEE
jgi:hypothetical protein